MTTELRLIALTDFPIVKPGDKLPELITMASHRQYLNILDSDILIITSKIVSKSENRLRDLRKITPSPEAVDLAGISGKNPQLVQLILDESEEVLRIRKGLIIVRHRLGFVCANAGIDHSNTVEDDIDNNYVLLLPEDPDASATGIRKQIEQETGKRIGVMIIDSHGRAWRNGTIGTTVGLSGVPGVVDLRGNKDLFGYALQATQVAAADELAGAASLLMGQADEGIPCVLARGFPYPLRESNTKELIRKKENDLFK